MVAEFIDKYPSQEFFPLKLDFLAEDEVIKTTVAGLLPLNAAIFTQGITNYQFLGSQELTQIEKIMQINLLVPIKITSLLESQLLKKKTWTYYLHWLGIWRPSKCVRKRI